MEDMLIQFQESHAAATGVTGCGKLSGNFEIQNSSPGRGNSSCDGPGSKHKFYWTCWIKKVNLIRNEYYECYL